MPHAGMPRSKQSVELGAILYRYVTGRSGGGGAVPPPPLYIHVYIPANHRREGDAVPFQGRSLLQKELWLALRQLTLKRRLYQGAYAPLIFSAYV